MKQSIQKYLKQISGISLLVIFMSFWVGTNFFVHTHIVNNVLIVHSHPFSPESNHQHSPDQLSLIQHLQHIDAYTAKHISTREILLCLTESLTQRNLSVFQTDNHCNISALRAPPVY